jgi:hypothetical protein
MRGLGRIDHDPQLNDHWIYFEDDARWELYEPSRQRGVLYDLTSLREPADALGFLKRWGLLWHSGASQGGDEVLEPELLSDWFHAARELERLLHLYALYRKGLIRDEAGVRALARYFASLYTGLLYAADPVAWQPTTDEQRDTFRSALEAWSSEDADIDEMLEDVWDELTGELHERLWSKEGTEVKLSVFSVRELDNVDQKPPGEFALIARVPNLVELAYYELALEMTEGTVLEICPEDQKIFPVRDPRQRYCTPQCAGRARYRRYAERKKAATGGGKEQQ